MEFYKTFFNDNQVQKKHKPVELHKSSKRQHSENFQKKV